MGCALGSIEYIEVVATIAAFVEHRDLGFQDRRGERVSTVSTSAYALHMPSHGPHPRRPQNELQETPQAMPPLYREAELEMNFPSSAAGRVHGTGDEEGRTPTSTSAQMDELQ